jgi:hypothetical protein
MTFEFFAIESQNLQISQICKRFGDAPWGGGGRGKSVKSGSQSDHAKWVVVKPKLLQFNATFTCEVASI